MTTLDFLTASLATLRLAYAVTSEDGPFDAFQRWRAYLTRLENEHEAYRGAWWLNGWFCILCVSFHIGWLYGVLFLWRPRWGRALSVPFALSALTLVFRKRFP